MRYPTGYEVALLRSNQRNFSRVYLGVQKGKEEGDWTVGDLMVGQHLRLNAIDGYVAAEHLLYFGSASLTGTDIRPNMTLCVGTATDPTAYGTVRIRAIGLNAAPTGDDGLYLEPNNMRALGYLQPGDYVWVDGIYRLYRKLPFIRQGTIFEDGNPSAAAGAGTGGGGIPGYGLPFIDVGSGNPDYMDRPVALMGSPRFAWTGEHLDFYGWQSHGRGTHGIQNWLWNFDGGVCIGPGIGYPGSAGYPVQARWNAAGEYNVSLTVEDNSGRAQIDDYGVPYDRHTAVRPVLVYDRPGEGDNPPYTEFEVESLVGKYGSGWTARIKVFGTADKSEFPDNALIIIYAEDWYGDQQGSIGGWYGQEGILFCGYIRADSVAADFEKSTVSFEAQTIEQWMKDISIWPANCLSTAGAPAAWHQFQAMTVEDVLWYLSEFRSNLKDVTDCYYASDVGAEKTLGFVDLTEASLYNQMSEQLGSCFFGKLSASRYSSIHLFKHKNMLDIVERTAWGLPVHYFTKQDWYAEMEIGEERMRDSIAQIDFTGFVYDTNGNPLEVYSLAPARQTNFGRIEKVSGILLSGASIMLGQAENNTLSGLYLAWQNIRFPHIRIHARNNRVLEPAELDYFGVVLVAADTERGYVWAGKEFLTTTVSMKINAENGAILVDVEGEASTWGPDGVAGEYPTGPPEEGGTNPPGPVGPYPPGVTPENPEGFPPPGPGGGGGVEESDFPIVAYLGLDTGQVIRGTNLSYNLPDDALYANCNLYDADGIVWMALDEFDPVNTAMVITPFRLYRTTNLSAEEPDWEELMHEPGINFTMIRSSPVTRDLWMLIGLEFGSADVNVWVTENGGDDWTLRIVTGPWDSDRSSAFLEMSSHDSNVAWVMWVDEPGVNDTMIAVTDNRFVTSTRTNFTTTYGCFDGDPAWLQRPVCHHRGYNNEDDSDAIYGGVEAVVDYVRLYQHPDCTTLYTADTPTGIGCVCVVGCGVGTRDRYWALAFDDDAWGFWAWAYDEDNDIWAWNEQYNLGFTGPGATEGAWDCKNLRFSPDAYIATHDGEIWPCMMSINRGVTWSWMWGNWLAMLTDEGISNPDVMVVCPVFDV